MFDGCFSTRLSNFSAWTLTASNDAVPTQANRRCQDVHVRHHAARTVPVLACGAPIYTRGKSGNYDWNITGFSAHHYVERAKEHAKDWIERTSKGTQFLPPAVANKSIRPWCSDRRHSVVGAEGRTIRLKTFCWPYYGHSCLCGIGGPWFWERFGYGRDDGRVSTSSVTGRFRLSFVPQSFTFCRYTQKA